MKGLRLFSTTPTLLSKTLNISQSDIPLKDEVVAPFFSTHFYYSNLRTRIMGRTLLHSEELVSTQTYLLENAVDDSTCCVADRQTSGRGRGENTWDSPLGCLMFSFRSSFPTNLGSKLPFFQYLVSLALIRSCRKATEGVEMEVNIKWPNDIYVNRTTKIGGILCQSHHDGSKFVITTGIGLNVENEFPTTCLSTLAKRKIRRELILAEFFNAFELIFNEFLSSTDDDGFPSFKPFLDEYHSSWLHSGQRVGVDQDNKFVVVKGVSPVTAALLAVDDEGKLLELTPDGNRLDFFKGLISKRVN